MAGRGRCIRPGLVTNEHHTTTAEPFSGVAVMQLHTQEAVDWIEENVDVPHWQEGRIHVGGSLAMEKRYVGTICTAIDEALGVTYDADVVHV